MDRTLKVAAVAVGALLVTGVLALDPPHDPSQNRSCEGCHLLHNSLGSSLTGNETNANLCNSCHTTGGANRYGFPWSPETNPQAEPGVSGYSHKWYAPVTSRGANMPSNPNMAAHLDGTNIICSTCHDQHSNVAGNSGTQHLRRSTGSITLGQASATWAPNGSSGIPGSGTMTLDTVTPTAAAKGYRVRVASKTGTQIYYEISHDRGVNWAAGPNSPVTPGAASTAVELDDGANVKVKFGSSIGAYVQNDYWEFWVSYPLLQMSNADGAMCVNCHANRDMRWQDVEGGNAATPPIAGGSKTVELGTTVFSHPVGQALNAKSDLADRTAATMLDATGEAQATSSDTNATNDLLFGTNGAVTCTTCHAVHNADSNSVSVDP